MTYLLAQIQAPVFLLRQNRIKLQHIPKLLRLIILLIPMQSPLGKLIKSRAELQEYPQQTHQNSICLWLCLYAFSRTNSPWLQQSQAILLIGKHLQRQRLQ
ncbi:unnamed protein product [Blepharisma stoltei]|uniref:Uncharacterized protein n=1 Tax=Blepharisma stoltei TaxID=1481888 RepID=A0AAU9JZ78_9CILI|nr:unnamed protein product [Blepharisma stoltei]